MAMAVYMVGVSAYNGFSANLKDISSIDNDARKRLYTYAKKIQ